MAVGTPALIATNTVTGTSQTVALTVSATGAAVGEHVFVVAWRSAALTGTTFSDSKGNTYQTDFAIDGTNGEIVVGTARITAALVSSDTITATFATSAFTTRMIGAFKVSGLASSSWYEDRSTALDTAFSAAFQTTGKANVQESAFLVGVGQASDRTWTSTSPWTEIMDFAASGSASISMQYQTVASAASRSTDLVPSSAAAGLAVMAIYKASLASGGAGRNLTLLGV